MAGTLRAMLLVALAPIGAPASELCNGVARSIEPDMQILESDLTTARARESVEGLRTLVAVSSPDQTTEFGIANHLQRLTGYTMRQQALEDIRLHGASAGEAKESIDAFCRWLVERGAWYD